MRKWHGDLITCPGSSVELIDNKNIKTEVDSAPTTSSREVSKALFHFDEKLHLFLQLLQRIYGQHAFPSISVFLPCGGHRFLDLFLFFAAFVVVWLYFVSQEQLHPQEFTNIWRNSGPAAQKLPPFPCPVTLIPGMAVSEMAVQPINNKLLILAAAVQFSPAVTHI